MLLIGIGNSGRGDDGLGWEFIERVSGLGYDFLDYEFRYQLQVEDAELIANYDIIVFVDASHDQLDGGFEMRRCISASHSYFTTHAQAPEAILHLANNLYNRFPKSYTLAISGEKWEMENSLSLDAKNNLQAAFEFFVEIFLPTVEPVIAYSY
jgi:hydrogenase maturation protease